MTGSENMNGDEKHSGPAEKKAEEQTELRELSSEEQAAVDQLVIKAKERHAVVQRLLDEHVRHLVSLMRLEDQRRRMLIPKHPSDDFVFTEKHLSDLPRLIELAEQERLSRCRESESELRLVKACDGGLVADRVLLTLLSTRSTIDVHYETALQQLRRHEKQRRTWMDSLMSLTFHGS